MWSEWLARTLRPRRAEDASTPPGARKPRFTGLPDLEGGMHPGADEFRSAIDRADVDAPAS
jgi:hypothetical protein